MSDACWPVVKIKKFNWCHENNGVTTLTFWPMTTTTTQYHNNNNNYYYKYLQAASSVCQCICQGNRWCGRLHDELAWWKNCATCHYQPETDTSQAHRHPPGTLAYQHLPTMHHHYYKQLLRQQLQLLLSVVYCWDVLLSASDW